MPRNPGLAWVTLATPSAAELIEIAAALDCGSVALLGNAPGPGLGRPIAAGEIDTIRSMLGDGGIALSSLDILPILPDFDPDAHEALLALGAALGAQRIGTLVFDPDPSRAADKMAAFAGHARAHGLLVGVEFVSFSPLRTLADAVALVDRVDDPALTITFDTLHFARSGGKATDLDEAAIAKIGYVQICDGPETMEPDRLMWEATVQRMIPGEGGFDLAGMFERLPDHLTIDIEAPLRDLQDQGVPPLEQARRLVSATNGIVERARAARASID